MQTDYSRAILKYLMDYSNMDYPVNIHQIYEHLFYGQELSDNKTKNEILNSTVRLCGGIYSNTVDIYYFI